MRRQIEAHCGDRRTVDPFDKLRAGIKKSLKHIGLDPQPPPRPKARRVDLFVDDRG
jgi:hypothetical protein